jgi:hypothetical protein
MSRNLFFLLTIVLIVGVVSASRPQDDHWLCQTENLTGREAVWDTPSYTFVGMPSDLGAIPIDPLFIDEAKTSAYYLMWSPSKQELWVFPMISFKADSTGTHDFCMPQIYDLSGD